MARCFKNFKDDYRISSFKYYNKHPNNVMLDSAGGSKIKKSHEKEVEFKGEERKNILMG